MRKLKGYFSLVRPPKIDFFEKCGKHGSGPVEKWSKMSAPKSGFQRRRWQTDPFFGLLGPFWGGGGRKIEKNFQKIFSKSRPNVHFWSKKFSKIFRKVVEKWSELEFGENRFFEKMKNFRPNFFPRPKKGQITRIWGPLAICAVGTTFFEKSAKSAFFDQKNFFRKNAFFWVECAKFSAGDPRCFWTVF